MTQPAAIDLSERKTGPVYTRHVNETTILISDVRLLDPASGLDEIGGLLIEQGRIRDFGPHLSQQFVHAETVHNLKGLTLIPGMVDARVHLGEPGDDHRETIPETLKLAAFGGVTSVAGLPNTSPALDQVPNLQYAVRRAREAKVAKLYILGAATRNLEGETLTEIGGLTEAGAVGLSNGNAAITRPDVMLRLLAYAKAFDQRLHHFPQEPSLSRGSMNKGAIAMQLGLSSSSRAAEILMVQRDIQLAKEAGAPLHLGPLTCADSLDLVRRAKAQGSEITCSTAPQYFCLNELEIGDYRTFAKLAPPLRAESDRLAVIEAIADGTVDIIVSDHCPQDVDAKRVPFEQAAFGMVGLETLLPLSLTLHHARNLPVLQVLRCLTSRPAEILGLNAGRLKIGNAADLAIVDLDAPVRLSNTLLRGKNKNSPLEGFPAQGKPVMTFVDGRLLFDHR